MMRSFALLLVVCAFAVAQDKKSAPDRWEKAIVAIEKRDKAAPPTAGAVFFCGSSSIVRWDLKKHFGDLKAYNRGFGGSQIADSTRFAERIVTPYRPATVVFYAGDNDIAAGKTAEQVAADFRAFVRAVHAKSPTTRILFLSIKPSVSRWKRWETMRQANALIEADSQKDRRLGYVDVATPMLGKDGRPRPELFVKDGLHLAEKGYELWTGIVRKHLAAR